MIMELGFLPSAVEFLLSLFACLALVCLCACGVGLSLICYWFIGVVPVSVYLRCWPFLVLFVVY
ncbi:hypothetical protein R69888_00604 [Paraburkholderia haematera]|uniref:NADH dehydrogenase subunit 1 n=1 Tax=Paraburkholderia haematera TaxID=2793077 RepID=A0ABN7KKL7_9BURK|nr:hypothetical protein R69888_00604 [Paraburkholderia haematera]